MITLILIVSVLFNLVLCYATVNLLRKNEMQEDQMEEKDGMIYLYGMAAQKAYPDLGEGADAVSTCRPPSRGGRGLVGLGRPAVHAAVARARAAAVGRRWRTPAWARTAGDLRSISEAFGCAGGAATLVVGHRGCRSGCLRRWDLLAAG